MDKHFDRILQLESPNSIGRNDHLYSKWNRFRGCLGDWGFIFLTKLYLP